MSAHNINEYCIFVISLFYCFCNFSFYCTDLLCWLSSVHTLVRLHTVNEWVKSTLFSRSMCAKIRRFLPRLLLFSKTDFIICFDILTGIFASAAQNKTHMHTHTCQTCAVLYYIIFIFMFEKAYTTQNVKRYSFLMGSKHHRGI